MLAIPLQNARRLERSDFIRFKKK